MRFFDIAASYLTSSTLMSDGTEQMSIRVLTAKDARSFRSIRLEALKRKESGKYFGTSYEEEKKQSLDQWRARCSEDADHCVVGLFDNNKLVGISAVTKYDEERVLLGSSYIKPRYRHRKFAPSLNRARIEWAKQQHQFKQAIFFIRDGNIPSMRMHEKYTAAAANDNAEPIRHVYDDPNMRWANGEIAPGRWYQVRLCL